MKTALISSCVLLFLVGVGHTQVVNLCYQVDNGVFVPDVSNCSNYYTCMNNVGYLQTCPGGFVFSSEKQSCDYVANVDCLECPADATELTFIPIPSVCNKFIICAGGKSFYQSCASGLEYNNETNQCDFTSKCQSKPATCPPSTTDTLTFLPGSGCTKYTICYKGTGFSQSCAANTLFDKTQNACVPSDQFTCPTAVSARSLIPPFGAANPNQFELKHRRDAGCPAKGTKSIPHPSSCSRYLFCVDGQSALLSCAQGLHFDSKSETCRVPKDADCRN